MDTKTKEQARDLHYKLIDLGLPNDGPTNSNARNLILAALTAPAALSLIGGAPDFEQLTVDVMKAEGWMLEGEVKEGLYGSEAGLALAAVKYGYAAAARPAAVLPLGSSSDEVRVALQHLTKFCESAEELGHNLTKIYTSQLRDPITVLAAAGLSSRGSGEGQVLETETREWFVVQGFSGEQAKDWYTFGGGQTIGEANQSLKEWQAAQPEKQWRIVREYTTTGKEVVVAPSHTKEGSRQNG